LGATTVALINDDQVKKVFGIFLIKTRPMFVFCYGLINREVHFPAFVNLAVFNLPTRIPEGCKHLILRIVDQDVPISEVKNLGSAVFSRAIPTYTPELPADLEGNCGFSGASGHCEKHPLIALYDSLDDAIDSNFLIVTLALINSGIDRSEKLVCRLFVFDLSC